MHTSASLQMAEVPHPSTNAVSAWLVRIGLRALLWTLGAVVIVGGLVAWMATVVFFNNRLDTHLSQQREFAKADARLSASNLNLRLGQARSVMQILATDQSIVATLARFGPHVQRSPLPTAERGARWMADSELYATAMRLDYVVKQFGLNSLWLSNAAGDTVAEGHAPDLAAFVGTNYADRDYFKSAQNGQIGRQFAIGRITNTYGLFLAVPVQVAGQFVGMVGIGTSVPKFRSVIEGIDAVVTDDLGVIVLSQDASLLMQTMFDATVHTLSQEARNSRYKRVDFEAVGLQPPPPHDARSLFRLQQFAGRYVMASHATDDGSLRVYAMRDLGASTASYQRDQRAWFGMMVMLIAAVALLLFGIAQYLIAHETQRRQLVQLNRALTKEAQTDPLTGCANRRTDCDQRTETIPRFGPARPMHTYGVPIACPYCVLIAAWLLKPNWLAGSSLRCSNWNARAWARVPICP